MDPLDLRLQVKTVDGKSLVRAPKADYGEVSLMQRWSR